MTIRIQVEVEAETLKNALLAMSGLGDRPLEYKMKNNEPHAAILEYGSGIFNEQSFARGKNEITAKTGKMLIIPVFSYHGLFYKSKSVSSKSTKAVGFENRGGKLYKLNRPGSSGRSARSGFRGMGSRKLVGTGLLGEAAYNASRYPDIMSKLQGKYSGVQGFVFRKSVKGQRPQRIVRRTEKVALEVFASFFGTYLQTTDGTRHHLAEAVNEAGEHWQERIKQNTPILTGRGVTGWHTYKKAD